MKVLRSTLACVVFLSMMNTACAQVGKVTVVVTDHESGEPLSGVIALMGFVTTHGMESGPENDSECTTDSVGKCSVWGYGNGGSATVVVMDSPEYYGAWETIEYFRNGAGSIAKPWNPTIQLRLKKKRNPIPMYAMKLSQKRFPEEVLPEGYDPKKQDWIEMPADSGTVAWDLEKGDWVEPYGKGEIADFIFKIHREARKKYVGDSWGHEYLSSGATVEVTVSNEGDGFIPYPVPEKDRHRGLRMPYEAPADGYMPTVTKYFTHPKDGTGKANLRKDMNYFFQVRTVRDQSGKIISALYGKIYGEFLIHSFGNDISFTYYLNPTPNDRNVEFKVKSNLFSDLIGTKDPYEP